MDRPITRSVSKFNGFNKSTADSANSRIPSRPKKIRKLSTSTTTTTTTTRIKTDSESTGTMKTLSTKSEIDQALTHLRRADPLLATLINTHDPPTFDSWRNDTPFLSLTKSIIYQQLSTKAANAIYGRFLTLFDDEVSVTPDNVLAIPAPALREVGLSERKSSYLQDLAGKFRDGLLSNEGIVGMGDDELVQELTKVKGIGAWTVHMFMIFTLRKPDVLPVGDLGVRKGVQCLYGLKALPDPDLMESLCEKWRPFRSVGSWYMWRLIEANAALAKSSPKKKGKSS